MYKSHEIVQDRSSAFPIDGMYASDAIKNGTTGLSKRMYIAIQALNGMLSHSGYFDDKSTIQGYVHRAYAIADEVIKQENM